MAALRHDTRLEKDGFPKTSIRRKLAENPLVTDLNNCCLLIDFVSKPAIWSHIMKTTVMALAAVLFVCGVAVAQGPGPDVPEKVLRELEFMVGNWRTVMTEDGERVGVATHQRRWSPNRKTLIMTWKDNYRGESTSATAVSGWNAKEKAVVEHWYGSDGTYGSITYPLDRMTENSWEGTSQWVLGDGEVTGGKCRLVKGDDQWVFTADRTIDGKRVKVKNVTKKTGQRHAEPRDCGAISAGSREEFGR
jgi:hypothetical protein